MRLVSRSIAGSRETLTQTTLKLTLELHRSTVGNANEIEALEEEGARWPHRSSKPAWQPLRLPEGSTPSPLRQARRFAAIRAVICSRQRGNACRA
jgi:hypothetical protein